MAYGHERKKQKFLIPQWKYPGGACPKRENADPQSLFQKTVENSVTFLYILRKIPLIRISCINECQVNLKFCGPPTE